MKTLPDKLGPQEPPIAAQTVARAARPAEAVGTREGPFRTLVELLEAVNLLAVRFDLDGTVTLCNDHLLAVTGYTRQQVLGHNWFELACPPEEREEREAAFRADLREGRVAARVECRLRTSEGPSHLIAWNQTLLRNEQGEPADVASIGEDITLARQAEAQRERRTRQLQAIGRMGQSVLASLDLQTVLKQVVDEVSLLLPTHEISILLRENGDLVFAAVGGRSATRLQGYRMPADIGVAGEVIRTGRPAYVTGEEARSKMHRAVGDIVGYQTQSMLAVPLKRGSQVLGLLEAVMNQPEAFNEDDLHALESASQWASIAIDNAQQHTELARRLQETQAMADINLALSETLDLEQILKRIVNAAQEIIPQAEATVIHLLQDDNQVLQTVAVAGMLGRDRDAAWMHPGEGIAGRVLSEGHAINVGDVQSDPHYVTHGAPPNVRALLVAPLQSSRRLLGTISVQSAVPGAFSTEDERMLSRFGIQASIALQNARLFDETSKRANQLALLYDAGLALNSVLEPRNQLRILFELAQQTVRAKYVAYFRFDPSNARLFFEMGVGGDEEALEAAHALPRVVQDDKNLLGWVVIHRRPLSIDDLRVDPRWKQPANLSTRSGLWVPVTREDRLLGVLAVLSSEASAFTVDQQRLMVLFANQAAVALENARLYAELETSLRKEQTMRAQLVLADKLSALGRMVASVAHELNNPLQSLQNCLFILSQGIPRGSPSEQYMDIARSEIDRLSNLVGQLSSVYQSSRNRQGQKERVGRLLQDVQLLIAPHLKKHRIKYRYEPASEELEGKRIPVEFKQVFLNLCLNAVDAMEPGGGELSVSLRLSERKEELAIAFEDTGHGIRPEDLPHIFEPFFTTKETGIGLGLAICYDIVNGYGGRIEVTSQLGVGTVFTVWLPLVQPQNVV